MKSRSALTYFFAVTIVLGATFVASASRSRNSGLSKRQPRNISPGRGGIGRGKRETIHRESKKRWETMREDNERGHEDFDPKELNKEIESKG